MSETPEARTRRRWINIGEIVGILALVISAASFWDSHREREAAIHAPAPAAAKAAPLILTGSVDTEHDRIDLRPARADDVIQTQTIRFPTTVLANAVDTTGNARIEAAWFDSGLRAALKAAGTKASHARRRVAVGIETVYVDGDTQRTDRSIYDIGYRLTPRFLRPDAVEIEGVSLVQSRIGGDLQKRVDARFAVQSAPPG